MRYKVSTMATVLNETTKPGELVKGGYERWWTNKKDAVKDVLRITEASLEFNRGFGQYVGVISEVKEIDRSPEILRDILYWSKGDVVDAYRDGSYRGQSIITVDGEEYIINLQKKGA